MRVLDLFSGIGGISLGLERAGAETVAFCEIDPYASRVLEKQWPNVPNIRGGVYALNGLLKRAQTASRLASRVRTYPSLAQAPGLPEAVQDSSGRYFEPFAWFDRGSRSWRTWQRCLVEGWAPFSGTWPRSGMTRNGIAFRRAPLVPLTSATEFGSSLPTPEASNTKAVALRSAGRSPRNFLAPIPTPSVSGNYNRKGASETSGDGLATWVKMWPTPVAKDTGLTTDLTHIQERRDRQRAKGINGNGFGMSLGEAVRRFPTPRASANENRQTKPSPSQLAGKHGMNLATVVGGSLNPTWVEWLMGFPLGWTALDASEIPSSRKSSKRSVGR